MVDAATDCAVFAETVVFLSYFKDLRDPRQQGKVEYPLDEILLLCLLAVLAGAETFVDIALFGRKKLGLLRRFRPFAEGTPAHDHLGDILAALDAGQFQRCFIAWVAALTGASEGVIAIDGKTVRRSHHKNSGRAAIHMVSAFAARQRLVLGQIKVAEKSNEIVAIPKLLDMLAIEGAIVTIDAMGCQREIAQKIIDKKADYVLALKGNQGSLREDVEVFVAEQKAKGFKDTKISRARSSTLPSAAAPMSASATWRTTICSPAFQTARCFWKRPTIRPNVCSNAVRCSRFSCWTSIASRTSTTRSDTRPAMRSSRKRRGGSSRC